MQGVELLLVQLQADSRRWRQRVTGSALAMLIRRRTRADPKLPTFDSPPRRSERISPRPLATGRDSASPSSSPSRTVRLPSPLSPPPPPLSSAPSRSLLVTARRRRTLSTLETLSSMPLSTLPAPCASSRSERPLPTPSRSVLRFSCSLPGRFADSLAIHYAPRFAFTPSPSSTLSSPRLSPYLNLRTCPRLASNAHRRSSEPPSRSAAPLMDRTPTTSLRVLTPVRSRCPRSNYSLGM